VYPNSHPVWINETSRLSQFIGIYHCFDLLSTHGSSDVLLRLIPWIPLKLVHLRKDVYIYLHIHRLPITRSHRFLVPPANRFQDILLKMVSKSCYQQQPNHRNQLWQPGTVRIDDPVDFPAAWIHTAVGCGLPFGKGKSMKFSKKHGLTWLQPTAEQMFNRFLWEMLSSQVEVQDQIGVNMFFWIISWHM